MPRVWRCDRFEGQVPNLRPRPHRAGIVERDALHHPLVTASGHGRQDWDLADQIHPVSEVLGQLTMIGKR